MMSTKYIHYGHNAFRRQLFVEPTNIDLFVKPRGGLWASPVDAKWGWKDWCKSENFRECCEENSFTFTLSEKANVIHIRSTKDLDGLPIQARVSEIFPEGYNMVCLDFEKLLSDGVDAIELHLSEEQDAEFLAGLYWDLYGWDCDSILILNPDVIVVGE